jgi:glycosyltransferase involved in cell wall biosynthesis
MNVTYVMITNQKRKDVAQSIKSVAKELQDNDDLVVVGATSGLPSLPGVTYLEQEQWALFGNTSHMRNAGYDNSKKNEIIVFMDDDIVLPNNYRQSMLDYVEGMQNFTSCTPKVISCKGFALGSLGIHQNFDIYISMMIVMTKEVFENNRWDEEHGYYYGPADRPWPEDVQFSYTLVKNGYPLVSTRSFYVYLNDPEFYVYVGMNRRHRIDKAKYRTIKKWDEVVMTKDKDQHIAAFNELMEI